MPKCTSVASAVSTIADQPNVHALDEGMLNEPKGSHPAPAAPKSGAAFEGDTGADDVIARLRDSQKETEREAYRIGREAGADFARHRATADELERLSLFAWSLDDGSDRLVMSDPLINMRPSEQGDVMARAQFWLAAAGGDWFLAINPRFMQGFVRGAAEVWAAVAGRL